MEVEKIKNIIEAICFAAGRAVTTEELILTLEINSEDLETIIASMQEEYKQRGIQLIKIDKGYQLCSKTEYHDYIYPILDKRTKPRLSGAALETLAIIAYNQHITRAEIEAIRGVNSDASIYKLVEYGLVAEAGKTDLPGKPMAYKTTNEFLKMFGYETLNNLPELPRYKLNENKQIVIDDLLEKDEEEIEKDKETREENNKLYEEDK